MTMRVVAVVLVLAVAAGAVRAEAEIPLRDVELLVQLFDRLADAVVANGAKYERKSEPARPGDRAKVLRPANCTKMAEAMNEVISANAEAVAIAVDVRKKNKKLPAAADKRVAEAIARMWRALQPCAQAAAVKAALDKL